MVHAAKKEVWNPMTGGRIPRRGVFRFGAAVALAMLIVGAGIMTAAAQTAGWAGGPFAAGDNTYDGFIDAPTTASSLSTNQAFLVNGWVVDKTAQGWAGIDMVHVYDGPAGQGGTFLGQAAIALGRSDVGTALNNPFWSASGFNLSVPANTLGQGSHTLFVYAHTPSKGWWYKTVTITVNRPSFASDPLTVIEEPTLDEQVPTSEDFTLKGYSIDRNAGAGQGTGVSSVDIWLGQRGSAGSFQLGAPSMSINDSAAGAYGSQFSAGGWQLTFSPTKYHEGDYTLYVYAKSSITGKESVTTLAFHINES